MNSFTVLKLLENRFLNGKFLDNDESQVNYPDGDGVWVISQIVK